MKLRIVKYLTACLSGNIIQLGYGCRRRSNSAITDNRITVDLRSPILVPVICSSCRFKNWFNARSQ